MMLTVEERLRLCHQGTAWHGDLIKKQLTELAELLAAIERSDAESLAMYHSARDRADRLQREIDKIKQTEFSRRVEKVAGYDDRHEPIWWQFYNERFVEMVVLECADHLSKLGEFNSSQNTKNHFGIEE